MAAAAAGLRGNNPLSAGVCLAEAGRVDRTTRERRRWKRRRKKAEKTFFSTDGECASRRWGVYIHCVLCPTGCETDPAAAHDRDGGEEQKKFPFSGVPVDGVWRRCR